MKPGRSISGEGLARAARALGWIAALPLLLGSLAVAQAQTNPQEYLKTFLDLRGRYGAAGPQQSGCVELRGVVQGKVRADDKCIWLVRDGEGSQELYRLISTAQFPQIDVGMRVRVVGLGPLSPLATLELFGMITELQMAEFEKPNASPAGDTWAQRAAAAYLAVRPPAPATAPKPPGPPAAIAQAPVAPRPGRRRGGHAPPATATRAPEAPGGPKPPHWREPSAKAPSRNGTASRSVAGREPALSSRSWDPYIERYRDAIRSFNPRLPQQDADLIARSILAYSVTYGVDARLVMAVIAVESNFDTHSTSYKGAMGLGQLMPGTAAGLGVQNAYDPVDNIKGAVRLIRGHLETHAGKPVWEQLSLALASYNAGSGAVRKYGGVPPYKETQHYVDRVSPIYRQLCGIAGE